MTVALLFAAAGTASGDIWTGTLGDPVDEPTNGLDIEQVRVVYDRGLGTATATIRVYGGWPASPKGYSSGSVTLTRVDYSDECAGFSSATDRGEISIGLSSSPGKWGDVTVTVRGEYEPRTQKFAPTFSEDRREFSVTFSDSLAVNADNRCIYASTSNGEGGVYDDPDKVGNGTSDSVNGYFAGWTPEEVAARKDTDGDGVADPNDKCPNKAFQTADGCKPPRVDTDGDGRFDDVDDCPTEFSEKADGCLPVQQKPSFSASSGRSGAAQRFRATAPGCWDKYTYDAENHSCVTLRLALYSATGKLLQYKVPNFWSRGDGYSASYRRSWSCDRAGSYLWKITYINSSFKVRGKAFKATESGRFSMPRCRAVESWFVSRATAARRAYSIIHDEYYPEFVHGSQCNPAGSVRGGKASTWRCRVTHNNLYRECDEYVTIHWIARDRWGRGVFAWEEVSRSKKCGYY